MNGQTEFTSLKIAALVVGGIAVVIHITAVAYPEWDGIDAIWYPVPGNKMLFRTIKSQGSLWDLSVEDGTRFFFYPVKEKIETSWKKPIVLLATTGIGAGVLGEVLMLLTALLGLCTKKPIFHTCAKITTFSFLCCAAYEALIGAILYKYNYQRQQVPDINHAKHLPFDEHVLKAGFYLECAAGALFFLSLFLFVLDAVNHGGEKSNSVSPLHNDENP